jgi:hypothetical protein
MTDLISRDYQYVVVRDEIVIVATKIETTGSPRPSTPIKVEIREGVTLPQEVEILDVPQTIVTEVPELRMYR